MDVRIREGRREDHKAIWAVTMDTVWADLPEDEREGLSREAFEAHLEPRVRNVLESPDVVVFVAEGGGGGIVGYVVLGAATSMLSPEPFGFLYDVWVAPHMRRQGIARHLLERANAWCRLRGFQRIKLEASMRNEGARALYRKAGFREERLFLGKRL